MDVSVEIFVDNKDNLIDLSLMNAIRRIAYSELDVVVVDYDSIEFYKNTSSLNNDYLSRRLSLIPVINKDLDFENLEIVLNRKNTSANIESVYSRDFVCKDKFVGKEVDIDKVFTSGDFLFTQLKPGNELHLKAFFTKNSSKGAVGKTSAFYSPVSNSAIVYEFDEKDVDEAVKTRTNKRSMSDRTFKIQKGPRFYKKNSANQPAVYIYKVETVGQFPPEEIFNNSIDKLIEKLEQYKDIEPTDQDPETGDDIFVLENEDDTLGNVISEYLRRNGAEFAGYVIPNPFDKKVVITAREYDWNKTIDNIVESAELLRTRAKIENQ